MSLRYRRHYTLIALAGTLLSPAMACVNTPESEASAQLAASSTLTAPSQLTLTGTVRDLHDTHPDFEYLIALDPGIVKDQLGSDGKPVYAGQEGNPTTNGQEAFDQWYNDVPGINEAKPLTLTLLPVPDKPGLFSYRSNSFFPIDNELFGNEGRNHNFHFTYELHSQFTYRGGEVFEFTGDDDLWIFVNGSLVLDLGGVHHAIDGTVDLDTLASDLGLTLGKNYNFDIFFAERHTTESNFNITTSFALEQPSECTPPVFVAGPVQSLWPPNHKYVTVTLSQCGSVTDSCDGSINLDSGAGVLTSISSDEPEEALGNGDGHTYVDMIIADDHTALLRAEREGASDGRVYTLHFDVTDSSGNTTSAECKVEVPHDQGPKGGAVDSGPVYSVP